MESILCKPSENEALENKFIELPGFYGKYGGPTPFVHRISSL